nr:MAG TPA: hypothetical protein [Caudoviricetes sp.]
MSRAFIETPFFPFDKVRITRAVLVATLFFM